MFALDVSLPLMPWLISEVNQVVLNMVINAAHAIEDRQKAESGAKGTITITTRPLDRWAEIEITDTGAGMTDAVLQRVFDPFYTTKEVGKGTGQGLSIAYVVIVDKHGGTIDVRSEPGNGTTFTIRLPLGDTSSSDRSAAA